MTEQGIAEAFNQNYIPIRFFPDVETVSNLMFEPKTKFVKFALQSKNESRIQLIRRGLNISPPSVGVIYDAYLTKGAGLFSDDVVIGNFGEYTKDLLEKATTMNETISQGYTRVKEVLMLSHIHHDMIWHRMVSENFRVFSIIPFIQRHPDIKIHITVYDSKVKQRVYDLFGITPDRFIKGDVKADIVYFAQVINRDDVPSVGLTYMINYHVLNALNVPESRRRSVLDPKNRVNLKRYITTASSSEGQSESDAVGLLEPVVEVNLLFIVRKSLWKGRMIYNYEELKSSIQNLTEGYDRSLKDKLMWKKRSASLAAGTFQSMASDDTKLKPRSFSVKINILEHMPEATLFPVFEAYSKADIIIGPHGAGIKKNDFKNNNLKNKKKNKTKKMEMKEEEERRMLAVR